MPNIAPLTYLSNIQFLAVNSPAPSEGIFIPLGALPGLTADECDPYNGDVRKLMYELNRAMFAALNGLEPENQPARFDMTRGTPVGINPTTVRQSYTTTFDLDITGVDVAAEANSSRQVL